MKFWSATVVAAAALVTTSSAFQSTTVVTTQNNGHRQGSNRLFADPKEMTEYMVKAHEEKLRAVQQAEAKKNAEIENLKKELKSLQSAPGALATTSATPPPAGMDIASMTKEQLAQKLISYQQFMAKYIVDAQLQKTKAIAAAENSVRQKYEEKLKLLSGSSGVATPAAPAASSPAFQQRSAKVSAAAAAGKSRWGDMENQKASQAAGAVNGAVQVNGAVAPPPTLASPPSTKSIPAFDKRNAMVAAAGKAGKSRWGEMEVVRATQAAAGALPSSSSPPATPAASFSVPPEVEAADHGLRADGGVGGPSLAERINFGAQLVNGPAVSAPLGSTTAPTTYYDKRNAMIAAAGAAGKSRWGDREVQRAQSLVASLPASSSSAAATITVTPEIEAADHGLRADGGVGGPSLAQRVNLGAALLGP